MSIDFNNLRKESMENRELLMRDKVRECIEVIDKGIYEKVKKGGTTYSILVGSIKNMVNNKHISENVLNSIISYYKQQGANVYIGKQTIAYGVTLNELVIDWSNA